MGEKVPISVLLPVRNEELNIREALESVKWADEIFVVDSQSTDRTVEIAREYTDKIVQFHYSGGWPKKQNWALDNLSFSYDWVFILAADERVTPELKDEIIEAITTGTADGYWVDRELIFLGRPLRHCFRPNWCLRLFKHRLGRYERLEDLDMPDTGDIEVHEHIVLKGRTGYLKNPLIHHDFRSLSAWLERHNRYSNWEAGVYLKFRQEPLNFSIKKFISAEPVWRKRMLKRLWVRLPFRPVLRFLYLYLIKKGFLDGKQGLIYCILMAIHEFIISIKIWELKIRSRQIELMGQDEGIK